MPKTGQSHPGLTVGTMLAKTTVYALKQGLHDYLWNQLSQKLMRKPKYLRGMGLVGQIWNCMPPGLLGEIESEEEESTEGDHQKCFVTERYILQKAYFHAFLGVQILASSDISGWHSQSQDYSLEHKPQC